MFEGVPCVRCTRATRGSRSPRLAVAGALRGARTDIYIDPGNWVPVSSPPEAEIPKLLKTKLFARS